MAEDENPRSRACHLFWQGATVAEIARRLALPYATVDAWKRRDAWGDAPSVIRVESHVEARLMRLVAKPEKSDRDLAEMDQLARILERTARIQAYEKSGREKDLNPNIEKRNKKKKELKNYLSPEQVAALVEAFKEGLFEYQRKWLGAKRYRVRNVLKARQIGATWYFALEAVLDAITSGDNQIFLSASKAQAHAFRAYIVAFVKKVTGVELQGSPITLWNDATLYFLGTNSKTAQSYHGHVYLDEYAWIGKFAEFRKVASAMATHKKWRITYFSTPSTIGHDAAAFWTGESFNKGRPRDQRVDIDVSHQALAAGAVCADGQWRHLVTIEDAARQGCDLFDLDQLKLEYNDQDFQNLYLCQWVDDSASYFLFDELRRCMVDSWEVWDDFDANSARPLGDVPVWIGYDPALSQDGASIVVVAPPLVEAGRFRVIEKLHFKGVDFAAQAAAIRGLTERYRVAHIGIDATTIGAGVFELVRAFFPGATALTYSVEVKNRMVLKAKHLISKRLIEWDAGWTDVAMAFMQIRRGATPSGRQATFQAGRTKEAGHADVAWAIMHAIDRVAFTSFDNDGGARRGGAMMELY